MKKIISTLSMLLLLLTGLQSQSLPEIKMPEIDYKPSITNGWVGQYVYEMHFNGKTSLKTAKGEVPYYWIKSDRIHTGFIELPKESRVAIRANQPDAYNKERYESWVRTNSGKTWSKVTDSMKTIEFTGYMGDIVNTGTLEKNFVRNTNGNWVEGWLESCDLQIDHTTGLYSFTVPIAALEIEEEEWGVKTNFKPEKKEPYQRKKTTKLDNRTYLKSGEWHMITDSFHKDQKEIVIRKRIPVLLQPSTTQGSKDIKLPAAKGHMDFYLVLRKMPFAESIANNKSSTVPDKPASAEQEKQKTNEAVTTKRKENETKKKPGAGGLLKKAKQVIGNN
jgi:hypothetical protein